MQKKKKFLTLNTKKNFDVIEMSLGKKNNLKEKIRCILHIHILILILVSNCSCESSFYVGIKLSSPMTIYV